MAQIKCRPNSQTHVYMSKKLSLGPEHAGLKRARCVPVEPACPGRGPQKVQPEQAGYAGLPFSILQNCNPEKHKRANATVRLVALCQTLRRKVGSCVGSRALRPGAQHVSWRVRVEGQAGGCAHRRQGPNLRLVRWQSTCEAGESPA